MYKYKKHETYTQCSLNVNSDSIMGGFCKWNKTLHNFAHHINVHAIISYVCNATDL